MASSFPQGWQARFVSGIGATTSHVESLCSVAPLRVTRGSIPVGDDAGVADYPLVVTDPYLKVEWSFPADIAGVFTATGKVKILRRPVQFSRQRYR